MHTLILFGASGDLAKEKLYPALFDLFQAGEKLRCIGFARTPLDEKAFRTLIHNAIRGQKKNAAADDVEKFLKHCSYVSGAYDQASIAHLKKHLTQLTATEHAGRLSFYLATPMDHTLIRNIVGGLMKNDLIDSECAIALEKPFGFDGPSAQKINRVLARSFNEEQIYRLDHYLAKGMVQDLLALRFANPIFEPVWNARHIERIDMAINETAGIRKRGQYYEQSGAIRDMLQNHALQLLAFTAMDQPESLQAASIHQEKIQVFRRLRLFGGQGIENIRIGQYRGYHEEAFVDPQSLTETSAALCLEIDTPRWRGVPITVASGKKMGSRSTDITILFRKKEYSLWDEMNHQLAQNSFHINIQPDNDIRLRLNSEFDSQKKSVHPTDLRFGFLDNARLFKDPYENALHDFFHRDQGIFLNAKEIALSWKLIDSVLRLIAPVREKILQIY